MADTHSHVGARAAYAGLRATTLAARLAATGRARAGHRHEPPPTSGGLRVLMIAMYPESFTGTKYRLRMWAERLRRRGHDVELALTMPDRHSQRLANDWSVRARTEFHLRMLAARLATVNHADRFHVAVVHLNDLPFWDHGPPFIADAVQRLAGRLVLDLDDLPHELRKAELVSCQLGPGAKPPALGALVDGLVVGNSRLANHYPGQPWWWVPTCVEPSEWLVPDRAARPEPPLLGWVGTPGNRADLEVLAPVLAEVCDRHRTKVRVVCSEPARLPGVPQEFVRWSAAGEQSDLEPMGIGLAPLADAPLQQHKCGLKALQYMASGMPVIGSPVGALREILRDGDGGLVASAPEEWRRALECLIADRELRLRLGRLARRCVEERWSFDVHEGSFEDALRGVRPHGGA